MCFHIHLLFQLNRIWLNEFKLWPFVVLFLTVAATAVHNHLKNCEEVLSARKYYDRMSFQDQQGVSKSVAGWRLSSRINAEIENFAVRVQGTRNPN